MAQAVTDVVVRRRALVMAAVAVLASGVAAAYLWRFSATGETADLIAGALLGIVGACYGFGWFDARTPLLVVDATGVRIRLGSAWTGVPWDRVDHVEVASRGRVRDGRVTVLAVGPADVLGEATRRTRRAAGLNRWLYDAPLVVPYGVTTSVSTPDLAGSLEQLAQGRAAVVVLDGPDAEPEATVHVAPTRTADSPPADPALRPEVLAPPPALDELAAGGQPSPRRRRLAIPRRPGEPARAVAYTSTPARREEVTIALRSERKPAGALALSGTTEVVASPLPEILQLRRSAAASPLDAGSKEPSASNVSLIIDATTDLSAQAMRRVRIAHPGVPDSTSQLQSPAPMDVPLSGTFIGHQLTEARTTLGLTIDELAERTRIRPYVIESMEVDDFSPCGGNFYATGHLRMLARVLGIDAEPLVEAFDEHLAVSPVSARDVFQVELATGSTGVQRGRSTGANWGALIAAVLVLILVWGVARYLTASADSAPAASSPRVHPLSPGSTVPTGARSRPALRQAQVKLTAAGGDSRVVVRDRFRHLVFAGVLSDGRSKKVQGEAPLRVGVADAGVVSLSVKGKKLDPMGDKGKPGHQLVRASAAKSTTPIGGVDAAQGLRRPADAGRFAW